MNTIITIGRQFGSGGHEIGEKLAKEFGIPFYDRELLERASKDSGFCKEVLENHDEKPTSSFLYSLVMDTYSFSYTSGLLGDMPLNQKVFLAQFDAIRKLAEEGPCIMIGRCADYALEDRPDCLNLFIYANMEKRIQRVARLYDLTLNKAKDRIQKADKERSSYYNYYTSKKWGDLSSYHMAIDSSAFGIDGAIELIKDAVAEHEKNRKKMI